MASGRVILGSRAAATTPPRRWCAPLPGRPVGAILASEVLGQGPLHGAFGGVVPEIAARAHAERLDLVTEAALARAGLGLGDLDAVAVTAGPGLIGGVLAGVMFAKGLAAGRGLPLYGVNHLAGHALTPRLIAEVAFPYLDAAGLGRALPAPAGRGRRRRSSGSAARIDDAPGEAFDKVAKLARARPAGRTGGGARGRSRRPRGASPFPGRCSTGRGATCRSPG